MSDIGISAGVTGFIDILGFGKKIEQAHKINDVQKLISEIKRIQDAFNFKTNHKIIAESQVIKRSTTLAFSDCVVINLPFESESANYSGSFDNVMDELIGFAFSQGECVLDSLFIRGGLDMGWWYQNDHTLVGQSMLGV